MALVVGVIDYGAGNLRSISRALTVAGADPVFVHTPEEKRFDVLLLPGVGAFGAAMQRLTAVGMPEWITAHVAAGTPLIGVCLGMQLLYAGSEEGTDVPGLGLLAGYVRRLPPGLKVPHMGWNQLSIRQPGVIADRSVDGVYVYFVHSYVVDPVEDRDVVATTWYGIEFPAIVRRGRVAGLQFHPEKSGDVGHRLLAATLGAVQGSRSVTPA